MSLPPISVGHDSWSLIPIMWRPGTQNLKNSGSPSCPLKCRVKSLKCMKNGAKTPPNTITATGFKKIVTNSTKNIVRTIYLGQYMYMYIYIVSIIWKDYTKTKQKIRFLHKQIKGSCDPRQPSWNLHEFVSNSSNISFNARC